MTFGTAMWRSVLCIALASGAVESGAQQPSRVAAVSGWRGPATRIRIFNRDGTPRSARPVEDVSALNPRGLLEWDTDFDLIKLTTDPGDPRWVQASDLNVTFCAGHATPSLAGRGSGANNKGITMGSGATCP